MRHLLEAVARALRAHREMAVAAATAIVAAALTGGGQGNLAAVVTMGAAGLMAGRAYRYRLAAQSLRRQVAELGDELSSTEVSISLLNRLVREREEDIAYIEKGVRMILVDGRKTIGEYEGLTEEGEEIISRSSFLFSEVLREWSRELDALETTLNSASQELIGEQTQLADLYDTEEVNTTDTATAEE